MVATGVQLPRTRSQRSGKAESKTETSEVSEEGEQHALEIGMHFANFLGLVSQQQKTTLRTSSPAIEHEWGILS